MRRHEQFTRDPSLRGIPKLLGENRHAMRDLMADLDRQAGERQVSPDRLRQLKGDLNDWLVDSLQRAEKAGVQDWDSAEARRAFGFDGDEET